MRINFKKENRMADALIERSVPQVSKIVLSPSHELRIAKKRDLQSHLAKALVSGARAHSFSWWNMQTTALRDLFAGEQITDEHGAVLAGYCVYEGLVRGASIRN